MTYSQTGAEHRGGARASFERRCREIKAQYENHALGTMGVTLELMAAIRELDRRKPRAQGKAKAAKGNGNGEG